MMFRALIAGVVLACACAGAAADPAPAPPSPPQRVDPLSSLGASSIDPRAMAAARRVVVAQHQEQLMIHSVEVLMPSLMHTMAAGRGLSAAQEATVVAAVVDEIRRDPGPLVDMVAISYARHLSVEDMSAMADFYESPAGQRYITTLPQIQTETVAAGQRWGQEVLAPRLVQRLEQLHQNAPGHT